MERFRFKKLCREHAKVLSELEKACFALPWSERQCASALDQQTFAAWGIWQDQSLLAYISFYHIADEIEILNLAVSPQQRRQGLAHKLLNTLLQAAVKMGIQKIVLEVRAENQPAIALYKKCGFKYAGRRPKYYPDTGEDALIYTIAP